MQYSPKPLAMPAPRPAGQASKVLLLEDDESLKTIITEFLEENGWCVTSVRNGVEGVRKVMAGDFDAIICDMLMPKLPGDMFFLAVERLRPHLCPRFIFITGLRGNPRIAEFIRRVNGALLTKPFRVGDLLDMVRLVQVKASFHSNN